MDKNKSSKKIRKSGLITGIIVGTAVGSVFSLLFAPDKGKNTRQRLSVKSKVLLKKGATETKGLFGYLRKKWDILQNKKKELKIRFSGKEKEDVSSSEK